MATDESERATLMFLIRDADASDPRFQAGDDEIVNDPDQLAMLSAVAAATLAIHRAFHGEMDWTELPQAGKEQCCAAGLAAVNAFSAVLLKEEI